MPEFLLMDALRRGQQFNPETYYIHNAVFVLRQQCNAVAPDVKTTCATTQGQTGGGGGESDGRLLKKAGQHHLHHVAVMTDPQPKIH